MASLLDQLSTIQNATTTLQHMAIAFLVLIVLSFALRLYTRVYIVKIWEIEDWTMVIAFVSLSYHAFIIYSNCSSRYLDFLPLFS